MLYEIYDGTNSSLFQDAVIEADSARQALERYFASQNRAMKFKRTGDPRISLFKATPFSIYEGRRYRAGRSTWFARL